MARPDRRAPENNAQQRGGQARAMATTGEKARRVHDHHVLTENGLEVGSNATAPLSIAASVFGQSAKFRV
jgi:hypothetical protein